MNKLRSATVSPGDALKGLERWAQESSEKMLPMPPSVYTSAEFLEQEIAALFYKEWICAGHVSELQQPGDYLAFDIVDKPVLIVCDETGKIRAFSNVCRHRGTVLASGSGKQKIFTCPYHAWSYDLNGCLRTAPYMDKEHVQDITLPEYRIEIWQGLIFVSLNADVEPLAPRLGKVAGQISPYDLARHKVVLRADLEMACNWKLLVENFCEGYHVFHVHSKTFEPEVPTSSIIIREGGAAFNHHTQTMKDTSKFDDEKVMRLPPELRALVHLFCIYPCLAFSIETESATWLSVRPTGPQSLKYTLGIALYPGDGNDVPQEVVEDYQNTASEFMAEDERTLELVQRGLAANMDNAGILHPWEQTNWEFGHYLARQLTEARQLDAHLAH